MTIPSVSNFPTTLDTNTNLFEVHDSLRVRLAEDYTTGDTSITIEELGDEREVMSFFSSTGFITLTEQQSDIDERALSFYYTSITDTTFNGLTLLPGFTDVDKPATITNITQNVMSHHHNALKDALIAVQTFVGIEGTTDVVPFGDTLEGRINFLTKLVLTPRAWFSVDRRIGLVPLCVTFTDESFRLGDGDIIYTWNFGDTCVSSISAISAISATSPDVIDGGSISKCYTCPGNFDVTLTVSNINGSDSITLYDFVNARVEAPDEAAIEIVPRTGQSLTQGTPVGGPYTTPPKIRSATNTFIQLEIEEGENPNTPGRSYGGELLDGAGSPIDSIVEYTWNLNDDLNHGNLSETTAAYAVGGLYDVQLRVDTQYGAYRITTYENSIDIIESQNLWLWNFQSEDGRSGGTVLANEFGLTNETFKTATETLTISRDNRFLDAYSGVAYDDGTEARAKDEFARNTAFVQQSSLESGEQGPALMFWSSGSTTGDVAGLASQTIDGKQFNGFSDTYSAASGVTRPWNWCSFASDSSVWFLFGQPASAAVADSNPSNATKTTYSLATQASTGVTLGVSDFDNGADSLLQHPSAYSGGVPTNGYFAVYRTAWKDNAGYILRNSGVNEFFRILEFYSTQGTVGNPFITITRLLDLGGPSKVEGELVTMSNGLFFFNNSGDISAYNETSGTWETAGPSLTSSSFSSLQDNTVSGYDNKANRLLATSDSQTVAYLSYDYSVNAFIKFTNTDNTFSNAGARPPGTQFLMGIY